MSDEKVYNEEQIRQRSRRAAPRNYEDGWIGAGTGQAEEEIRQRIETELPHWYYEDGWIRRKYRTSGWKGTLMVVNAVGHLAEAAWHHPDLTVSYAFTIVK